ncbi:ethanolamine utilization protein EutP [Desulfovibrio desulfuricans]|uniref:EutP/PduV family microcompartment system protein n=1 Tax=Desulfovibrio desulfuricans TaxID=876 RepID=UPI0017873FEC|nr:EutP/PduV family microcompartment system protein [Desulfovibrio desulfuricans]MBD8894575.1 ethanolamine utilization protein EutP [Desulfovibrio desulfuricans]
MRRIMLMGERGVGRRTVARLLGCTVPDLRRTMAVEYAGEFVFPPPEFLENRRFYCALITLATECAAILFVQDATRPTSAFPPGFARIFNRTVVGVISKTDMEIANTERARRFLHSAGTAQIVALSSITLAGVDELRAALPLKA